MRALDEDVYQVIVELLIEQKTITRRTEGEQDETTDDVGGDVGADLDVDLGAAEDE